MDCSMKLNKISQNIAINVAPLLERPRVLGVLVACALAKELELPEGPVENVNHWFHLGFRVQVNSVISAINELHLLNPRECFQLVEALYCTRVSCAYPSNSVSVSTHSFLSYFTGADSYFTETQFEMLEKYKDLIAQNCAKMSEVVQELLTNTVSA